MNGLILFIAGFALGLCSGAGFMFWVVYVISSDEIFTDEEDWDGPC